MNSRYTDSIDLVKKNVRVRSRPLFSPSREVARYSSIDSAEKPSISENSGHQK